MLSSTCFEQPSVHPQEDFYMQFYGITFKHPYNQAAKYTTLNISVNSKFQLATNRITQIVLPRFQKKLH
jgi:hypothetical protein